MQSHAREKDSGHHNNEQHAIDMQSRTCVDPGLPRVYMHATKQIGQSGGPHSMQGNLSEPPESPWLRACLTPECTLTCVYIN